MSIDVSKAMEKIGTENQNFHLKNMKAHRLRNDKTIN